MIVIHKGIKFKCMKIKDNIYLKIAISNEGRNEV